MLRLLALPCLALLTPLAAAHGQATWPAARSAHDMVFHDRLRRVILLGGVEADSGDALWSWDGRAWRMLDRTGPVGRGHFGIAYDPIRNRVVVHGGLSIVRDRDPERFGDLWEWGPGGWTRIEAPGGPGIRDHHAMAWDPVSRQVILFGGQDSANRVVNETWGWNGRTWRRLAEGGPPPRSTQRLTLDPVRRVIVMFGGFGERGVMNDTWEWDGQRWAVKATGGPEPRFATRTAFDPVTRRIVLYGGRGNAGDYGDMWSWDGQAWHRLEVPAPPRRNVHALATDLARQRIVMFGGFNAPRRFDEVWEWDGAAWTSTSPPLDEAPALTSGPHDVGFRVLNRYDRMRAYRARADFEGRPAADSTDTPLQVLVWYPASGQGRAMDIGEYHVVDRVRESLREPAPEDRAQALDGVLGSAAFMVGMTLPRSAVSDMLARPAGATRDAPWASGRFPLVLVGGDGGASAGYALAEHLARHGYVVVATASLPKVASLQATNPDAALDAETHRLEALYAVARDLPVVRQGAFAVIGRNFGGMAALNFQMRNMSASAVVSIDGWEGKDNGDAILRRSPWFDVLKLRVPFLTFQQDNAPAPQFAPNRKLFDALRYADRWMYVLRDMDHSSLLQHLAAYPLTTAARRVAYQHYHGTIRAFLDGTIGADSTVLASMRADPRRGFPDRIFRQHAVGRALRPMPTADELEAIVMRGDVARAAELFRAGRGENPDLTLFTRQTLNLYAFRFWQRGERSTSIEIRKLVVEAFPRSAHAHNELGNAYRDNGQPDLAAVAFERALELLDADPELAAGEKEASRTTIRNKVRALRPAS